MDLILSRADPLVYKWSIFDTSESLHHAVCNACILLPNRGHAVQFLVIIYGHGRSVTKFSASKGLDLEGSFKFAVRMSFAAEWSKRHCGGSVVILLHPVTSSYLFLAFQGTWVHVLQSVSAECPHTLSRATFGPSKLGPTMYRKPCSFWTSSNHRSLEEFW